MKQDETLPALATDEDISKELGDDENTFNENEDSFVYFKSSSIISILIIVMISLVCILTTGLLVRTVVYSHSITRTLSIYLGFTPNRTIDESKITYWAPKSIYGEQPIETTTAISSSPSTARPPPVILNKTAKKAQIIFRNFILPSLFFLSILCGILAFCMRLHHHRYPAWGARPKRPERYVTIELKQPKPTEHS